MGDHKIFINVGVGPSFDQAAFEKWIARGNYAILDGGSVHEGSRAWYAAQERISLSGGRGGIHLERPAGGLRKKPSGTSRLT